MKLLIVKSEVYKPNNDHYFSSPCEFFKPTLVGGLSLESEWQQVCSNLQDSIAPITIGITVTPIFYYYLWMFYIRSNRIFLWLQVSANSPGIFKVTKLILVVMWSTLSLLISSSLSLFSMFLMTDTRAPTIIGITVTFRIYSFFSALSQVKLFVEFFAFYISSYDLLQRRNPLDNNFLLINTRSGLLERD